MPAPRSYRLPQRQLHPGRPPGPPEPDDVIGRLLRLIRPGNLRLLAVLILVALAWLGFLPKGEIRGPAEIVDGDSFTIMGDRVRLYAIDAPELHQPCRDGAACGERARDHLAKLIAGRMLVCEKRDTDRYGRYVAQCYIDESPTAGQPVKGVDIGRAMVRDGHAMAYRSIAPLYVPDEPARFEFDPPWDWREHQSVR